MSSRAVGESKEIVKPSVGSSVPEPEGHIKRMAGSHAAAEEPYVDLYEHNVWLRSLTRWDWAAPFIGAGTLALGGGMGAIAAGESVNGEGVLVSLVAGGILLICGLILKDERSKDIREGSDEFDRRICLYDDEPRAKAIKARLDERSSQQAAEHTLIGKAKRLWTRLIG